MYEKIIDLIVNELRVKQCMRDIASYWSFRSTVPGTGLHKASEFINKRHREHNIESEIINYPADDKTEWLNGHKNPLEWVPRSAQLNVIKPENSACKICSYSDEPLSLICNSTSTPKGGVDAQVIVMQAGSKDEDYVDVDVSGKIIFTNLPAGSVEYQARKQGALGVISDCVSPPWLVSYPPVREPEDAPDLTLWSIFSGSHNDKPLWGFSLSARQGRRLRKIIQESIEPVILHAEVDADLLEGTSELVSAVLPGTDLANEEIWVLAHSSEPGANDNASGCCLSIELARTLKTLIDNKKLPPLRRTLRFMNAVEVNGFLPHIDSRKNELDNVIAGLCLDSIGQDFRISGGEIILFQSPETNASFVDGLMEYLLLSVASLPIGQFSTDNYATFPWHTESFWGNDAFISDGFFDIPTLQISAWPDRFYHSSKDDPDNMSENTLGRVGAIAGTFLYLLSTAGVSEAIYFAGLSARDWKRRICHVLNREAMKEDFSDINSHSEYLCSLGHHLGLQAYDAINQVIRFAPEDEKFIKLIKHIGDDIKIFALHETERAIELISAISGHKVALPQIKHVLYEGEKCYKKIVKRLRWRLPAESEFSEGGRQKLQVLKENGNIDRIWNWINSRRTIEEIWERVQFGGKISCNVVAEYIELLVSERFAIFLC
ncbi:MAG: DUF4910 domain-containing protein [bacterium]